MLSLADAILQEDIQSIQQLLGYRTDVNQIDEYGFTPLIEAAIVDSIAISRLLLSHGADPNRTDLIGGTALQWAAENNNAELCALLLEHRADPNAYNASGQPVLVMPMLRQQKTVKSVLVKAGANELFAQDYINTKLLGHMFELVGTATIVSPTNAFVEVDFEGFYLEVTLGLVAFALNQFQNHFAARQLRRYVGVSNLVMETITRAAQLIKFQQYRVDIEQYRPQIVELMQQEPVLIPVGYEGHAITFIKYGNIWVKCDRREDSRLYDNIMIYHVENPDALTIDFMQNLIYKKQDHHYINTEIDKLLGLKPITELKVDAQISGNCSWANVEATIPAIFFLAMMRIKQDAEAIAYAKTLALNFFHRWRDWNKDRSLDFCIQSYEEGDTLRKASKAEILAAILFQCCDINNQMDGQRIESIMTVLRQSPYEYLLKNYLRVYFYENATPEGKRFATLMKAYGLVV